MDYTFVSSSHEETIRLGRLFGASLGPGAVIGLVGDLGAGKTCFVKGVAVGLCDIPESEVTSPTFTIMQEYEAAVPLYHFDAYRLSGSSELENIGFDDYIGGDGACLIEWSDRIEDALPQDMICIRIDFVKEDRRRFVFTAAGAQHEAMLETFMHKLDL
ncbi:MAG: tRNA (adenosine(37)-N6)-threonylcarbamoyltransferase complex ATPase subunit type 1 TsaE [Deltaproteobacteria bacterium]|nr:tRNA (adenosine(37)-N6)-threonylcarbamoyltransferase complex ATPase subunit type 1 TsaE [Deltaproteobacteria bacterium]